MHFAWLFTLLSTAVVPLAKKLLFALGIGMVSYVGINFALDAAKAQLLASMSGVPADIAMLMGLFKFDVAINIVLSAVATRMLLAGVNKATGSKSSLGSVGGN
ncbi:DUF2523 domain-containing protein [Pseudomonas stutzeri]|uniref:DUF2523 domain-containing protein n=1 Tax=Stutzerimonas stutzeri TaxID=316 RepID=UPI00210C3233|nr:DUF2523 domain-containing protein [Stutzerimonas stutzeri]MCQ4285805.1 DUF2523 domain-containing protein [Stutzerimonas stutzeri]